VVAVSGGPDSVALVRGLVACAPQVGFGPLVLAHVNHQLRGEEGDADEAFVRELHARLKSEGAEVQLCCQRLEVAARARLEGENLEQMARQVRYDWLAQVARERGCRWVATGHTADDQAETVLFRLLRGTGLQGLRGIAARRELAPEVEVVRPLLPVTRAEVLAYLESLAQPYRVDSSNYDRAFTRNRLRHELLPQLVEKYNPRIVEILGRLAAQAEEVFREEEAQAAELLARAERPRAGGLVIVDCGCLREAPRHRVREALRLVWARERWPQREMGFAEWERLAAVVYGEMGAVDLPGPVRARRRGRVVQMGRGL
ncbi:MAG: tRNA lysidine(34) synthetase TilS, partial [Planctomycetes bacterium]|nr:tRNA lysidine(34) synthetase TilS [Planctomycetota bacterium]